MLVAIVSRASTPGNGSKSGDRLAVGETLPVDDLSSPRSVAIDDTLAGDSMSRNTPVSLAGIRSAQEVEPSPLLRGAPVGRFIVIDKVGAGGMGEVVAAFDPELDRRVAIKVIRTDASGHRPSAMARQRLLREAQAMAKVSHANVITVYDVGTVGERVFIAMEYVDGHTLKDWARSDDRDWREVVDVYRRAGQGLAAAHRAGLVHRDFKPDNVLIGSDGRVRVTDFGLVAATGERVDSEHDDVRQSRLSQSLTCTGAVMGTPLYMAPEQHHGHPADARADQFSFSVALHEALFGEPPFSGDSMVDIRESIESGAVRRPPRDSEVPARIRSAIKRGLRSDPEERYADMDELLAALAEPPSGSRRRYLLVAPIVVLGFAAIVVGLSMRATSAKCRQGAARLAGVWDETVRARVGRAMLAADRPYAEDTFRRVEKQLDDDAAHWIGEWTRACEATHIRGEQSEKLLDLRMACLDRRRRELGSLTALLGKAPDGAITDRAMRAAADLTTVSACADTEALTAATPLPDDPSARTRVAELRYRLDDARTMWRAGKYEDTAKLTSAIVIEARDLAYAPVLAEALSLHAKLESETGNPRAAAATLGELVGAAADAGDDVALAQAWMRHLQVVGEELGLHRDAITLRPVAEAAVRRAGNSDELQADLLHAVGALDYHGGQYVEARRHLQRALELREKSPDAGPLVIGATLGAIGDVEESLGHLELARDYKERALKLVEDTLGSDHPDLVPYLFSMGSLLNVEGKLEAGQPYLERALATAERALGPDHPVVARALTDLANLYIDQRKYDTARAMIERARTIRQARFGPDHPSMAISHVNLGRLLQQRGEYAKALAEHQSSLLIYERIWGPNHPDVATALTNLGNLAYQSGDYQRAAANHQRALEVWQKVHVSDHPDVGLALTNLGSVLLTMGKPTEARLHQEHALAIFEKTLGPDHPRVAATLTNLGNLLQAEGDFDRARRLHERSIAIKEKTHGSDHPDLATSFNNLGDTLFEQGELDDAQSYFERALAIWEKQLGPDHPDVAISVHNLGNVLHEHGAYDQAYRHHERALKIFAAALGDSHPYLGYPLTGMGDALVESGKAALAIVPLERALAIREARATGAGDLAMTRFALARALWDSKRDRKRALALAQAAAAAYLAAGKAHTRDRAEVVEWQSKHGR